MVKREPKPEIHWIRFNNHYVLWYRNFAVLIVSLIIPLVLLAYWNFNTLFVMMRRRRLRNRPSRPGSMNLIQMNNIAVNNEGNIAEVIRLSTSSAEQTAENVANGGANVANGAVLRIDIKSHQGIL